MQVVKEECVQITNGVGKGFFSKVRHNRWSVMVGRGKGTKQERKFGGGGQKFRMKEDK